MVAVAIFSTDPVLLRVDVLLADTPTQELLAEYRGRNPGIALVVLLDGTDNEEIARALSAGARAVLNRSASRNEIIAAVKAVTAGLVVVAPQLLAALFNEAPFAAPFSHATD